MGRLRRLGDGAFVVSARVRATPDEMRPGLHF